MKNLSIAFNLVLLAIIGIQSCRQVKPIVTENPLCGKTVCTDYQNAPAFNYLSLAVLKDMAGQYNNVMANYPALANMPDARSVWFPLETLKRFIWEIETNACKPGCRKEQLGIRIYYGRYPQITAYPDLAGMDATYQSRHSVFLIPTIDQKGSHYDFDPRYWNSDGCTPKTLFDQFEGADSLTLNNTSILALSPLPS